MYPASPADPGFDSSARLAQGREVLRLEALAIQQAESRLDTSFSEAVALLKSCKGRVIVSGLGKSGQVGRKIAATLASLGTPSAFVHPAEALHGDLGMIRPQDLVLMLSNSGETEELLKLLWFLEAQSNSSIVITGQMQSTLARRCSVVLDGSVEKEACRHNLAPTCSTAVAMALGDALAVTVSAECNFRPSDFARFHPSGSLGRRLLCTVSDVMRRQPLPCCDEQTSLRELIPVMTSGCLGVAFVLRGQRLVGIVTDGDLRRGLERSGVLDQSVVDLMSTGPLQIGSSAPLVEAVQLMQGAKVGLLAVVDVGQLVGAVQLYDCY